MCMGKKVVLKIVNGISVMVIVFAVIVLLSVVLTKSGEAPNIMGYSAFCVLTGSMEPSIHTDSFILVKRVDGSQIAEGDVISYYSRDPSFDGMVNTHRVVAVQQDGDQWIFTTKGDANSLEDRYPAYSGDLIGKVVFISHPLGVAVRLLANPLIFIPVILVPLLVLLIVNLTNTIRITKTIVREEEEAALIEAMEALQRVRKEKQALSKEDEKNQKIPEKDTESPVK